jgi:hypothetical protein
VIRITAEELVAEGLTDLPEGAYLTAAVLVVTYVVPTEADDDDRGPFLAWRCDGHAGRWVHLGMVETAAADMRVDLTDRDD